MGCQAACPGLGRLSGRAEMVVPQVRLTKSCGSGNWTLQRFPDVELRYYQGSLLALCGQKDVALRLLRSAIEQNYCSYEALEHDPAWRDLRGSPAFGELRSKAFDCQKKFLIATGQVAK